MRIFSLLLIFLSLQSFADETPSACALALSGPLNGDQIVEGYSKFLDLASALPGFEERFSRVLNSAEPFQFGDAADVSEVNLRNAFMMLGTKTNDSSVRNRCLDIIRSKLKSTADAKIVLHDVREKIMMIDPFRLPETSAIFYLDAKTQTIIYTSNGSWGAMDLSLGKTIWSQQRSNSWNVYREAALNSATKSVFFLSEEEKKFGLEDANGTRFVHEAKFIENDGTYALPEDLQASLIEKTKYWLKRRLKSMKPRQQVFYNRFGVSQSHDGKTAAFFLNRDIRIPQRVGVASLHDAEIQLVDTQSGDVTRVIGLKDKKIVIQKFVDDSKKLFVLYEDTKQKSHQYAMWIDLNSPELKQVSVSLDHGMSALNGWAATSGVPYDLAEDGTVAVCEFAEMIMHNPRNVRIIRPDGSIAKQLSLPYDISKIAFSSDLTSIAFYPKDVEKYGLVYDMKTWREIAHFDAEIDVDKIGGFFLPNGNSKVVVGTRLGEIRVLHLQQ